MSEFFGSVWWLLVSLGVLVTFHEFGHYWVARRCGVKVLRFSVGFGRPLWSRRGKDGTEYVIAAIPLGGYVKMLDEREGEVAAGRRATRPSTASRCGKRIAIVAAGPGRQPAAVRGAAVGDVRDRPPGLRAGGRPGRGHRRRRRPAARRPVLARRRARDADLERGAAGAAAGRAGPQRRRRAGPHRGRRPKQTRQSAAVAPAGRTSTSAGPSTRSA